MHLTLELEQMMAYSIHVSIEAKKQTNQQTNEQLNTLDD